MDRQDLIMRLSVFMENETRSCSMDFGGITPLYVYRMLGGSVAIEEIEKELKEIRKQESNNRRFLLLCNIMIQE